MGDSLGGELTNFAVLSEPTVIAVAMFVSGGLFLLWTALARTTSNLATIVLDLFSLLVGIFALTVAIYTWLYGGTAAPLLFVLGFAGAVLVGRSLRDLPLVGLVSAAAGGFAGYLVWTMLPSSLPIWVAVIAAIAAFLIVYAVLSIIGAVFKLVSLVSIPRAISALIAVAAIVAGLLVLFPLLGGPSL